MAYYFVPKPEKALRLAGWWSTLWLENNYMKRRRLWRSILLSAAFLGVSGESAGTEPGTGEGRISQADVESGVLALRDIRLTGMAMFATSFTQAHGYGDGPVDPGDPLSPGGRPTLEGGGTFLRVNGLDAQSCIECHSVVSAAAVPPRLGVGGAGAAVSNVMLRPTGIDVVDLDADGRTGFNGRFINPPFLFGTGGVELLAKEMTAELQALKRQALENPGISVTLKTKGVNFGTIVADAGGVVDTSAVQGLDEDLVVRPFGRKGEFSTVRSFAKTAMMFHFGMQPVEVVGSGIDGDIDGIVDEVSVGELSALAIFAVTLDRPRGERAGTGAGAGFKRFKGLGCTECHQPLLTTDSSVLTLSYPEIPEDPSANVFYSIDLGDGPPYFRKNPRGGLVIPLFSDLKRHDMGEGLRESFHAVDDETNREFITARLWGVADTAPYMHDGRAFTLSEAILMHGGDAQAARDEFAQLSDAERAEVLTFLGSLRTPENPVADLATP
jgi:hypothetical protein